MIPFKKYCVRGIHKVRTLTGIGGRGGVGMGGGGGGDGRGRGSHQKRIPPIKLPFFLYEKWTRGRGSERCQF